jgi:DUF971 family protein
MRQANPEPSTVIADVDVRLIRIEWTDGHESVYDFDRLRWACPCATCRGEMGRPGMLDQVDRLTPEQTELVDIEQVGRYALMPVWADGHNTGIFTYQYLRELG